MPQYGRLADNRWDDSDVPASILEAGSLFASRMRMSRSLRQLWDVREEFIKAERGWNDPINEDEATSDHERLEEDEEEEENLAKGEVPAEHEKTETKYIPEGPEKEADNDEVQRRLDAVNAYYVGSPRCFDLRTSTDIVLSETLCLIFSLSLSCCSKSSSRTSKP